MSNKEKQKLARSLFVKSSLNRRQIAEQVGCTEKTLRDWIERFGWENEKEVQTITKSSLLKDSYAQLKAINEEIFNKHNGVPTKALSDAKSTIRKEIETFSSNPLHIYVEVGLELVDYVQANHPSEILRILSLIDDFINYQAQEKKD